MFAHPQQHQQQQHQRLLQQEISVAPSSIPQSSMDFSALLPVFGVDPLQTINHPNCPGDFVHLDALVGGGGENNRTGNLPKPRKRGREEEMVASTSVNTNLMMGKRRHVFSSPLMPSNPPCRATLPPSINPSFYSPGDPNTDLPTRMHKDLLDLDHFITAQMERMKAEMEQRRRGQWAGVLRAVEDAVQRALRAMDEEIESAARRNSALEESINVLSMEGQLWKTLALTHEAAVGALRHDIELAQQAAAAAGGGCATWDAAGCGGEVEDSVSCCEGRRGEETKEKYYNAGLPQRCRVCRKGEVCRLVLPCRHLCLCGECDPATESCPLCGCDKNASIKVYL